MDFPKSTYFNRKIPKQKFYENLNISPALRRSFIKQIKSIYWTNKIAPSTLNLAKGKNVTEIEVFLLNLNQDFIDENVLKQIDREIPYHILFVEEYEGKYKAVIAYKEAVEKGKNSFELQRYYQTGWMNEKDLPVHIDGLNTDAVYENFIRQIAGESLQPSDKGETLKESVDKDKKREILQKQINVLQSKIRKEKQLNRQMELNAELKKLKSELESI